MLVMNGRAIPTAFLNVSKPVGTKQLGYYLRSLPYFVFLEIMDLSELSISELQALQNKISQEIKQRQKEKIAKAREQIMSIAQDAGLPLKELISTPGRGKGMKVAVRYRHPSEPDLQWTGRGHQPRWVREWIASGKMLDALRV